MRKLANLSGNHNIGAQSFQGWIRFTQTQYSTMCAGNIGRNRQPEADAAALVLIARGIQPGEGPCRLYASVFGNTGTVIVYAYPEGFFAQHHGDFSAGRIYRTVSQQATFCWGWPRMACIRTDIH